MLCTPPRHQFSWDAATAFGEEPPNLQCQCRAYTLSEVRQMMRAAGQQAAGQEGGSGDGE